ncbi:hypothetical protein SK3146_05344 [Paenibacillus konkukensis]|uniref:Transposase n=1 Tax=Paenibacillus konkukensis TaxID=2020716 RepID=A0ABY4RU78_9BACL|nr:hypothetical protein SK3146_05344 [Paenibacillus konkukensis]
MDIQIRKMIVQALPPLHPARKQWNPIALYLVLLP